MSDQQQQYVLVTGGAGFIGSHVVERALREGYHVTVLDDLRTGSLYNLRPFQSHPSFVFVHHNVQHPFPPSITVRPAGQRFSFIYHLACAASPVHYQADSIGTTLTCVNGTHNVLLLATQQDCPVFIASTSEVYGDPLVHPQQEPYFGNVNCISVRSCYDEGKRCAEALCFDFHRTHKTKIRVARIFNTYGPRMSFNDGRVISNFIVQALENKDITVYGTGEYTRSYQYVDDLVEGMWRLIRHPTETGPVNLGNPGEYTVGDTAKMILAMVPESASKIVNLPPLPDDPQRRRPDITKAKAVLGGWEPKIPVQEGLAKTLAEFRERFEAQQQEKQQQ
ncbi:dTDP-glucose 4,6-dehydratase [Strigomonas culicis]|uniref:UDP-glucuronic acid decarboxylase 1 n=1 Tax=Strigomonas culicis TaxID=28005 RepID=S9V102_9TRYP|nr:dTDP-glucose 4,6-dehydratase [Strigomonas culicis]|eukprot:EPY34678.1 dTDP-glucose 4,6-dehydratase [Strigomonas culicis]